MKKVREGSGGSLNFDAPILVWPRPPRLPPLSRGTHALLCLTDSRPPFLPQPHTQIPAPSLWDDATRSLTVVVPAYNEEERLPRALDELLRYGRKRGRWRDGW